MLASQTHLLISFLRLCEKIYCALLIASIPAQLLAWGPKGHAIVADIAASRLTPIAKQNLQFLLGADSLASIASWADSVRKEHDESYDWPFVDILKDASGFSEERNCFRPQDKRKDALTDHHNCVVERIGIFQKILATKGLPAPTGWKRLNGSSTLWAICTSRCMRLKKLAAAMTSSSRSLARPSVATTIATCIGPGTLFLLEHTGYSEEEYVGRLNTLIAQKHLENQAGGTPVDWANESHLQARHIIEAKPAAIDEAYYQANIELVNQKLALAGFGWRRCSMTRWAKRLPRKSAALSNLPDREH